jgi:DNA-binding beta-propeller fold protein YncE
VTSPDGRFAYVSSFSDKRIAVIRTDTNEIVRSFPVLSDDDTRPTGLAVTSDGSKLFVTNFNRRDRLLFGSLLIYELDVSGLPDPNSLTRRVDFRDLARGCKTRCRRRSASPRTSFWYPASLSPPTE